MMSILMICGYLVMMPQVRDPMCIPVSEMRTEECVRARVEYGRADNAAWSPRVWHICVPVRMI
jgi:hypothetical protein